MKTLNDYFDKLVCINLDRRVDRWDECKKQFEFHNLQVKRFSAFDGTDIMHHELKSGEIGAFLSHLEVIKYAKEQGLKNILIMEDDVEFCEDVNKSFFQRKKELPKWDFLYFGANTTLNNIHMNPSKSPTKVTNNIYRMKEGYTTHCYAVDSSVYDRLLTFHENVTQPIDVLYSSILEEYRSYVFHPPLAWQRPGYSDIEEAHTNHEFLKGN